MKKRLLIFWMIFLVGLFSCSAARVSPEMVQTAIASTQTASETISTSTPSISDETKTYLQATEKIKRKYEDATNDIQISINKLRDDPVQIMNDTWKLNLAANLVKLQLTADELGSFGNVPDELNIADNWYKMVKTETHELVSNLEVGIDYMDPGKISASQENMINIVRYLNNAGKEIRPYLQKLHLLNEEQ